MAKRKPPPATGASAPRVDDAAQALGRALRKLNGGQGRVGRASARKEVFKELRKLRDAVDERYPPIAAKRKVKFKKRRTSAQRMKALIQKGWVNVNMIPEAGVPEQVRVACINHQIRGVRIVDTLWVPGWIVAAVRGGATDAEIRAAKRSLQKRRALEAAATLRDLELLKSPEKKAYAYLGQ